jgi:hypothetical protein
MLVRRFIIAVSVAFLAISAQRSVFAEPTTLPSTGDVHAASLEDPTKPTSACYLDLDGGHVYAFGDSPEDLDASKAWMRTKGIDLMCESRLPVHGFVAYGISLIATDLKVDEVTQYELAEKPLRDREAESFQTISLKEGICKTYLFRTREGAIGILEAIARSSESPTGIQIRYRLLPQPPPQDTVPHVTKAIARVRMWRAPNAPLGEFSLRNELAPLEFSLKTSRSDDDFVQSHNQSDRFTLERGK